MLVDVPSIYHSRIRAAEDVLGATIAELTTRNELGKYSKTRFIAYRRFQFWTLLRTQAQALRMSYPAIAKLFDVDHTTVMAGVNSLARAMERDADLNQHVCEMVEQYRAAVQAIPVPTRTTNDANRLDVRINAAAQAMGVNVELLFAKTQWSLAKPKGSADARGLFLYVLRERVMGARPSYPQIAKALGIAHSTGVESVLRVKKLFADNPAMKAQADRLVEKYKAVLLAALQSSSAA